MSKKKKFVQPKVLVEIESSYVAVMLHDEKHDTYGYGQVKWAWYRSDEKTVEMAKAIATRDLNQKIKRQHLKEPK